MLKTAIALTVLWTPAANLHAQNLDHSHADAQRQAEVAGRGKDVMPFSLAATTHVFSKTAEGGMQQVIAKTPEDAKQVQLIRQHLQEIQQRGYLSLHAGLSPIWRTSTPTI